jgi:LPS sulfotransferase NodH
MTRIVSSAPSRSYLLCATPRTGSTLLCEALRGTGQLGIPEEYFEFLRETGLPRQPAQYFERADARRAARIIQLLGSPALRFDFARIAAQRRDGYQQYLSHVLQVGTTSNGIFGAKLMWGHLADFLESVTGDPDPSDSERVHRCLSSAFPGLSYIRVTRRDKVRQAISLWKAIQTQQWRSDAGATAPAWRIPVFDFEAIEHLRRELLAQDRAWHSFFRTLQIQPLVLCYEEVAEDLQHALRRSAAFLGLTGAPRLVVPSMEKQAGALTRQWVEQYTTALANRTPHADM